MGEGKIRQEWACAPFLSGVLATLAKQARGLGFRIRHSEEWVLRQPVETSCRI